MWERSGGRSEGEERGGGEGRGEVEGARGEEMEEGEGVQW